MAKSETKYVIIAGTGDNAEIFGPFASYKLAEQARGAFRERHRWSSWSGIQIQILPLAPARDFKVL